MGTKAKVTVGISFKDPGKYFKLALQSVFAQTFTDWELILMDDGSVDGSLEFSKSLKDPRVRVYGDGQCKKLNVRLNEIIQLAETPYFFRMDADDIMHPERLERQFRELCRHDSNTVIGSSAYSIDSESRVVGFRLFPENKGGGYKARHSFIHPTVAASTEWFRRNPYSEEFVFHRSQDAELWCRTYDSTRFFNMPEPLLFYREFVQFSLENYIGTSLGLLCIIQRSVKRSSEYAYLTTREMAKLLVACLSKKFGSDWLVKRRYRRLDPTMLSAANRALHVVQNTNLPV